MGIIHPQSQDDSKAYLERRSFGSLAEAAAKLDRQATEIQRLNDALAHQKEKAIQAGADGRRLWMRANAALMLLQGKPAHLATEATAEAELASALKECSNKTPLSDVPVLLERQAEAIRQLAQERDEKQAAGQVTHTEKITLLEAQSHAYRDALLDLGVPPHMLDPAVLAAYSASLKRQANEARRLMKERDERQQAIDEAYDVLRKAHPRDALLMAQRALANLASQNQPADEVVVMHGSPPREVARFSTSKPQGTSKPRAWESALISLTGPCPPYTISYEVARSMLRNQAGIPECELDEMMTDYPYPPERQA